MNEQIKRRVVKARVRLIDRTPNGNPIWIAQLGTMARIDNTVVGALARLQRAIGRYK